MGIGRIALEIRQKIFRMACRANGGHIAPAFSMTDLIAVLYFDNILQYNPRQPDWKERDIFILSKGHGALALYAALSMAGYFNEIELDSFCKIDSHLGSLAKMGEVPGVEATTGSLGHGLSFAVGIALANKIDKLNNKVYVLLGDGECEEGSIWEGLMSAVHHKLDNLIVIIDYNKLQAMDSLNNILSLNELSHKAEAFGLNVEEINGHDYTAIKNSYITMKKDKPKLIVAHTVKGKGVSFMENEPIWHYRIPNKDEMEIALRELNMTKEDLGTYENSVFRNII